MVESAIAVLFQMVWYMIGNVIETFMGLAGLFLKFMAAMGPVLSVGAGGVVLGIIVIGLVMFALAKFVFSSGKSIMILILLGILLVLFLLVGVSLF